MGRLVRTFTPRERSTFEQICQLKQNGVITMMRQFLVRKYGRDNVVISPSYLIAKGTLPVALVAHADTVFNKPPKLFFYDQDASTMWSPDGLGADDRAGIYSIIRLVGYGFRPHVIITTDEEHGCVGASKLITQNRKHPFDSLKFMIQLDRRGVKDSVYYDCANTEFEKFINQFGFETAYGSFSDISVIAPVWGVAAVNLSVGYHDEHSYQERLDVNAMFDTIGKVSDILTYVKTEGCQDFEYIEDRYSYPYESWYDDGYKLTSMKQSDDDEICCFCGDVLPKTDMLHLHYDENTPFYMCNTCYSANYLDVEWCSKCHKGWFLTKKELEEIKEAGGNRMNWVCRECKETNVRGNSGASESGSVLLTEHSVSADERPDGALDDGQTENDFGHEWSGL